MRIILIILFIITTFSVIGQDLSFGGVILLEDKNPAIGATIEIKSDSKTTVTDINGKFSFKNLTPRTYELEVNYVGTTPVTFTIDIQNSVYDYQVELTTDTKSLECVVIVSKSEREKKTQEAIQVESVDIKQVSNKLTDLNQVIDQLSGVRVRTSGALGAQADISLNGLNGSAVRTYIDGLPMEFLYPSLELGNIPMSNIKRIDVYKGVLPIKIGTDAMGGGINLIPQYKNYNNINASYSFGSFNTHIAALNGDVQLKKDWILSLNGAFQYSDNDYGMNAYVWEEREIQRVNRFNDAYRMGFANATLAIKNQGWTDLTKISINYADFYKELQHGGVVNRLPYGEANYNGSNKNAIVDYRKSFGDLFSFRNATAYTYEKIAFADTTAATYSWSGEVIQENGTAGEFNKASDSDRDQISWINRTNQDFDFGKKWDLSLTNLYARQNISGRDHQKDIERDILQFDQILVKNISGISLTRFLFQEKLELTAAYKFYYFQLNTVDFLAFSPIEKNGNASGYYATTKYKFNKQLFVRGSYEKAYRIPTYEQFFGNGVNIIPNSSLVPESSDNVNIGIGYRSSRLKDFTYDFELTGFLRAQKDIIFLTAQVRSQYNNAEKVSSRGVELEFRTAYKGFQLSGNLTRLSKKYDDIDDSNISGQFLIGTPFPNTPDFFGNVQLAYRNNKLLGNGNSFRIYTQYKYVDEFNFINIGQIRNEENWVPVQHRMDAGCTIAFSENKYGISFNVNNLLNKELFDSYKIPRPGRSFNVKLSYAINKL